MKDTLLSFLLGSLITGLLILGAVGCDGPPRMNVSDSNVEAYVVKQGNLKNPNAQSRAARTQGKAGVLCIEGKMYTYYESSSGVGLAAQGETCPDVQIQDTSSTAVP